MAHCLDVCVSVSQPLLPLALGLRHCLGTQDGLTRLKHTNIDIIEKLALIDLVLFSSCVFG